MWYRCSIRVMLGIGVIYIYYMIWIVNVLELYDKRSDCFFRISVENQKRFDDEIL